MLNKIKQTLNENDSQLELITIKRKKTMNKETNKTTSIRVMLADDLFTLAKIYEKKNQRITAFELNESNFKVRKNRDGSKTGYVVGFHYNIVNFETQEITSKGRTVRDYELQNNLDHKLVREVTHFKD